MAAVAPVAKKKPPRVATRIAVVEHPECDSYSTVRLMSKSRRRDLFDVIAALETARPRESKLETPRPRESKVVVFTPSAPMALLYANYIGIRFLADVVECAGHAGDLCTCVDDYLGVVDLAIILEGNDRVSIVAEDMGSRVKRETGFPQRVGNARLFIF